MNETKNIIDIPKKFNDAVGDMKGIINAKKRENKK
tara:strand:- start:350 stop:454 length:105 start_codon:yes stop_codon:yes gene_type:complete